jgi:putative sigma-54 modulation protein
MKLIVTGRHLTVSDSIRNDIGRKLRKLERLLGDSAVSAQCILGRDGNQSICELTVHARGDHMLHGVGRHARMPAAVTAAVDKVQQQAQKLKGRWKSRRRSAAPASVTTPSAAGPARAGETPARVIRARPAGAKPMSVDDAILALAVEKRPFLVFRDATSDDLAIIYKRPDGHYGLVEPEG